jgi:hypothetical protein
MMSDLSTIATAAGLRDPDLLKIAAPGLSPREAVADLQRRFPGAFGQHVRDMAPEEVRKTLRKYGVRVPHRGDVR